MPRPAALPTWDTTQTNVTTPTGGQQTSGYAVNTIPSSGVWNYLFNLVYQWINWLAAGVLDGDWEFTGNVKLDNPLKHGTYTKPIPLCSGTTPTNGQAYTNLTVGSVVGVGGPVHWVVPIQLDVGERILAVRSRIVDSTGPTTLRMNLVNIAGTTVATVTSLGNGTQQDLALTSLTSTVADDHTHVYFVYFDSTTGSNVTSILDLAVDYDHP